MDFGRESLTEQRAIAAQAANAHLQAAESLGKAVKDGLTQAALFSNPAVISAMQASGQLQALLGNICGGLMAPPVVQQAGAAIAPQLQPLHVAPVAPQLQPLDINLPAMHLPMSGLIASQRNPAAK